MPHFLYIPQEDALVGILLKAYVGLAHAAADEGNDAEFHAARNMVVRLRLVLLVGDDMPVIDVDLLEPQACDCGCGVLIRQQDPVVIRICQTTVLGHVKLFCVERDWRSRVTSSKDEIFNDTFENADDMHDVDVISYQDYLPVLDHGMAFAAFNQGSQSMHLPEILEASMFDARNNMIMVLSNPHHDFTSLANDLWSQVVSVQFMKRSRSLAAEYVNHPLVKRFAVDDVLVPFLQSLAIYYKVGVVGLQKGWDDMAYAKGALGSFSLGGVAIARKLGKTFPHRLRSLLTQDMSGSTTSSVYLHCSAKVAVRNVPAANLGEQTETHANLRRVYDRMKEKSVDFAKERGCEYALQALRVGFSTYLKNRESIRSPMHESIVSNLMGSPDMVFLAMAQFDSKSEVVVDDGILSEDPRWKEHVAEWACQVLVGVANHSVWTTSGGDNADYLLRETLKKVQLPRLSSGGLSSESSNRETERAALRKGFEEIYGLHENGFAGRLVETFCRDPDVLFAAEERDIAETFHVAFCAKSRENFFKAVVDALLRNAEVRNGRFAALRGLIALFKDLPLRDFLALLQTGSHRLIGEYQEATKSGEVNLGSLYATLYKSVGLEMGSFMDLFWIYRPEAQDKFTALEYMFMSKVTIPYFVKMVRVLDANKVICAGSIAIAAGWWAFGKEDRGEEFKGKHFRAVNVEYFQEMFGADGEAFKTVTVWPVEHAGSQTTWTAAGEKSQLLWARSIVCAEITGHADVACVESAKQAFQLQLDLHPRFLQPSDSTKEFTMKFQTGHILAPRTAQHTANWLDSINKSAAVRVAITVANAQRTLSQDTAALEEHIVRARAEMDSEVAPSWVMTGDMDELCEILYRLDRQKKCHLAEFEGDDCPLLNSRGHYYCRPCSNKLEGFFGVKLTTKGFITNNKIHSLCLCDTAPQGKFMRVEHNGRAWFICIKDRADIRGVAFGEYTLGHANWEYKSVNSCQGTRLSTIIRQKKRAAVKADPIRKEALLAKGRRCYNAKDENARQVFSAARNASFRAKAALRALQQSGVTDAQAAEIRGVCGLGDASFRGSDDSQLVIDRHFVGWHEQGFNGILQAAGQFVAESARNRRINQGKENAPRPVVASSAELPKSQADTAESIPDSSSAELSVSASFKRRRLMSDAETRVLERAPAVTVPSVAPQAVIEKQGHLLEIVKRKKRITSNSGSFSSLAAEPSISAKKKEKTVPVTGALTAVEMRGAPSDSVGSEQFLGACSVSSQAVGNKLLRGRAEEGLKGGEKKRVNPSEAPRKGVKSGKLTTAAWRPIDMPQAPQIEIDENFEVKLVLTSLTHQLV